MELALSQAATAVSRGQTPFGSVLVDRDGLLIGEGHNRVRADLNPTTHAEIVGMKFVGGFMRDSALEMISLFPWSEAQARNVVDTSRRSL